MSSKNKVFGMTSDKEKELLDKSDNPEKEDIKSKEKQRAIESYEKLLADVQDLSDMCESATWRKYYAELRSLRAEHGRMILIEEKTRAMVAHQEAIKIIDCICDMVSAPVRKLNEMCNAMPLFAGEYHTRAQWNSSIGRVDMSDNR
jgi:hypothetical protein